MAGFGTLGIDEEPTAATYRDEAKLLLAAAKANLTEANVLHFFMVTLRLVHAHGSVSGAKIAAGPLLEMLSRRREDDEWQDDPEDDEQEGENGTRH